LSILRLGSKKFKLEEVRRVVCLTDARAHATTIAPIVELLAPSPARSTTALFPVAPRPFKSRHNTADEYCTAGGLASSSREHGVSAAAAATVAAMAAAEVHTPPYVPPASTLLASSFFS